MRSEVHGLEPGYHRESLETEGTERLVLRFPVGNTVVNPSEDSSVHLELDYRGAPRSGFPWKPSIRRRESLLVIADESVDGVTVTEARVRIPSTYRDLELHSVSGDVDVRDCGCDILATTESGDLRIVGGLSVEVSSVSGSISLRGMSTARVRSIEGTVRCSDLAGLLSVENQSGDVQASSVQGNAIILTHSGEISVQKPGGRLRLISSSGDIELELAGPFAGGEVNSAAGDISLQLDGSSLELRGETLSGTIRAPEIEVQQSSGPRRCAFRLGSGGRRLHVKSVSGDIEIEL